MVMVVGDLIIGTPIEDIAGHQYLSIMSGLTSDESKSNGGKVLRLQSPVRDALPLVVDWSWVQEEQKKDKDDVDPCFEILETIKYVP